MIDQELRVEPLPAAASRPSWPALGIVAALTLVLGFGAGYSYGSRPAATNRPEPSPTSRIATASGSPSPSAVVRLPTAAIAQIPDSASSLTGRLVVDGPCLLVVDDSNVRWLPIWPAGDGYRLQDGVLTGSPGTSRVGDVVRLAGIPASASEFAYQRTIVDPIDPACQAAQAWIVLGASFGQAASSSWPPVPTAPPATRFLHLTRVDLPDPAPDVPNQGAIGVVAFRGGYVALGGLWTACCADGDPATNRGVVWTSPDGRAWRLRDGTAELAHATPAGLVTDGARLVAFGTYAAPVVGGVGVPVPAVWASSDGITWTRAKGPVPSVVAAAPGGFVGAFSSQASDGSTTASFAWSPDGLAWTATSTSMPGWVADLAVSRAGNAVALGTTVLPSNPSLGTQLAFWSSPDAHTWTDAASLAFGAMPVALAGVSTGFVMGLTPRTIQPDGSIVERSEIWRLGPDGRTEGVSLVLGNLESLLRLFAAGDVVMATGTAPGASDGIVGRLWLSVDRGSTFGLLPTTAGFGDLGHELAGLTATRDALLAIGTWSNPGGPRRPAIWLAAS